MNKCPKKLRSNSNSILSKYPDIDIDELEFTKLKRGNGSAIFYRGNKFSFKSNGKLKKNGGIKIKRYYCSYNKIKKIGCKKSIIEVLCDPRIYKLTNHPHSCHPLVAPPPGIHQHEEPGGFTTNEENNQTFSEKPNMTSGKKRKISETGYIPHNSVIHAIVPDVGPIEGNTYCEIYFSVSKEQHISRLERGRGNFNEFCFFGNRRVTGEMQVLVERNIVFLRNIRENFPDFYEKCSMAQFRLATITPPAEYTYDHVVDVTIGMFNEVTTLKDGYRYTEKEVDCSQCKTSNNIKNRNEYDDFPFDLFDNVEEEEEGSGNYYGSSFESILDENIIDKYGCNVLFYAVAQNRMELVIECLLKHKFDISKKDVLGFTVVDVAEFLGRKEILAVLESYSSDDPLDLLKKTKFIPSEKNPKIDILGRSELFFAITSSKINVEEILKLVVSSDLCLKDVFGNNVFDVCSKLGLIKIPQYLFRMKCQCGCPEDIDIDLKNMWVKHVCSSRSSKRNTDRSLLKIKLKHSLDEEEEEEENKDISEKEEEEEEYHMIEKSVFEGVSDCCKVEGCKYRNILGGTSILCRKAMVFNPPEI